MTYAVDFERSYDRGDYRFWLRRIGGRTKASKAQFYNEGRVDPDVAAIDIDPEELPDDLKADYNILCSGSVPVLRTAPMAA